MTDEQTKPHYIDQQVRGGWKLHATFVTDPMGRNTMQLVCPELRGLTPEESGDFLENAVFMIKYIMGDQSLDCQLLPTKPGYKRDKIVIVGPNEDLIKIAQGVHAMSEMEAPAAPEWTKANTDARRSMLLQSFASKATPQLLRTLGVTDPSAYVSMHIQLKDVRTAPDPQSSLTAQIDRLDKEGHAVNVHVCTDKPVEPSTGIVKITGPMKDLVRIAMKYGEACGTNYKDLSNHIEQSAQHR